MEPMHEHIAQVIQKARAWVRQCNGGRPECDQLKTHSHLPWQTARYQAWLP